MVNNYHYLRLASYYFILAIVIGFAKNGLCFSISALVIGLLIREYLYGSK